MSLISNHDFYYSKNKTMSNYHNHMNHSWITNLFFGKICLQAELRSRSQKVSYQIRKPICMKKIIKKIRMFLCRLLLVTCRWLTFLVHSTSQKVYTNQISFHYKSRSFLLYYPLNFLNLICFKSNKGMIFGTDSPSPLIWLSILLSWNCKETCPKALTWRSRHRPYAFSLLKLFIKWRTYAMAFRDEDSSPFPVCFWVS